MIVQLVNDTLRAAALDDMAAFALWVPNDPESYAEPEAVSACSSSAWSATVAKLSGRPSSTEIGIVLDPQAWDHPDLPVGPPPDPQRFEEASRQFLESVDLSLEPVQALLNEAARRVALAPPIPTPGLLVAMATDGQHSDDTLANVRYASSERTRAELRRLGLLPARFGDQQ